MRRMGSNLPTGTVTFLFTDVEGSTRLLHQLGADEYARALSEHRRILREEFGAHGGVEVDTQGDAFFVAFSTAPDALASAEAARRRLADGPIRVRAGVHTGTPLVTDEGYVGVDVHRAARIAACGHGGQVLVSAATAALAGTERLLDLGVHRLKDLSAPERIYQLGTDEFPPLASLHQTNLPIPATPFLGREKELGEVLALLSRDDVRLLTLTGPGGTGKTRLGAQAAGALAERYPHGVWWIPLAALRDPALVAETAAKALGARDGLADHIGDKAMLLLFDNFEQVLDAAPEVSELITSCPNLELIVTSREPLRVTAEQEYEVPPFVHEEGVGFFLSRARAIQRDFETDDAVAEICRRLDNLPLALELAAARVKALTSRQILDRLEQRLPLLTGGPRDLPVRQRTLRATIAWSYDLLGPDEQRLFARLSAFRGGCTLEAAEQVVGADIDTLHSLVDKSLVRRTGDRYWMLETIREYAGEHLEENVRRRHAEYFVQRAERLWENYEGGSERWLDANVEEQDNLRAALDTLEAAGEHQLELQLAGALWRFWMIRGQLTEARRRLRTGLNADDRPTAARARALNGACMFALETGDHEAATEYAEEALAIHRRIGDSWAVANSILLTAHVNAAAGNHKAARDLFADALKRFRELGDDHYVLLSMRDLAWMEYELGNHAAAGELHEEVVRGAEAAGNERMEQTSLGALAEYALYEERVDEAIPKLERAFELNFKLGEFREITANICRLARAFAYLHKPIVAARLLGTSEALHETAGAETYPWVDELNNGTVELIKEQADHDAYLAALERGRSLGAEQSVAAALAELPN